MTQHEQQYFVRLIISEEYCFVSCSVRYADVNRKEHNIMILLLTSSCFNQRYETLASYENFIERTR